MSTTIEEGISVKETKVVRTIDLTPPAVTVRLEEIKPEEGTWAYAVGARDTAIMVYERDRPRGIVFQVGDGWQLAATGHQRYPWPGGAQDIDRDSAIWFLCMSNHIVTQDSPKYTDAKEN